MPPVHLNLFKPYNTPVPLQELKTIQLNEVRNQLVCFAFFWGGGNSNDHVDSQGVTKTI